MKESGLGVLPMPGVRRKGKQRIRKSEDWPWCVSAVAGKATHTIIDYPDEIIRIALGRANRARPSDQALRAVWREVRDEVLAYYEDNHPDEKPGGWSAFEEEGGTTDSLNLEGEWGAIG